MVQGLSGKVNVGLIKIFPAYMESKFSPCSRPYPEPVETIPKPLTSFIQHTV
jgi:hypothetical protein